MLPLSSPNLEARKMRTLLQSHIKLKNLELIMGKFYTVVFCRLSSIGFVIYGNIVQLLLLFCGVLLTKGSSINDVI